MKDNLIFLDTKTKLDIPAERVREAAEKNCEKLIVIGIDKDGNDYYAANFADAALTYFMVSKFQHKLLAGNFSGED